MILPFPHEFPVDAVEQRVAEPAQARALVAARSPQLEAVLARRRTALEALAPVGAGALLDSAADAVRLAYARLALRHGSWGEDFHAYHNEGHILEIFDRRIERLMGAVGAAALGWRDWLLLGLFAACHDLRQREVAEWHSGVGANERASIEEGFRILDLAGFARERDADLYLGLDLTIAGSTFDARPASRDWEYNSADAVHTGGALAAKLTAKLDKHVPHWQSDVALTHAQQLALVAADLDTANVAEPFGQFVETGLRLCLEREMRLHRSPEDPASALPVLGFQTDGQERFFFDLHRFNSELGRAAFAAAKAANAAPLKAVTTALRARVALGGTPRSGSQVIDALRNLTQEMAARRE